MWVGGVADSQTRSKPLKTPKNAFFDPNFTFCFSKSGGERDHHLIIMSNTKKPKNEAMNQRKATIILLKNVNKS